MRILKYVGGKRGGMPVTFPIGVHSKGAITRTVVADPFIKLSESDAERLLELEEKRVAKSEGEAEANFVEADKDEYAEHAKDKQSEAALDPLASMTDEEIVAYMESRKRDRAAREKGKKAEHRAKGEKAAKSPKAKKGKKAAEEPEAEPEATEDAPAEADEE